MFEDLLAIGVKPVLAGCAVLVIACAAGWGMARETVAWPIRIVGRWVDFLVGRILRSKSWLFRSVAILTNNATVCAVLILVGGVPGGGWTMVTVVGLSMGVALHRLSLLQPLGEERPESRPGSGAAARLGLVLNLFELPAIVITLGLSMGQNASPNNLPIETLWSIYVRWVAPCLIIAACGESLWIGRISAADSA